MISKKDLLSGVATIAQALGNTGRLELVELLAQRDFAVTELADAAHMNIKTTSAHLRVLKEAGLVAAQRDGSSTIYRLANPASASLVAELYSATFALNAATREMHSRSVPPGVALVDLDEVHSVGSHTLIDVRPPAEFEAGHLDGASNIAVEDLAARMAEIPGGDLVLVYCRGPFCLLAHQAATVLTEMGRDVAIVNAGGVGIRARQGAQR